MSFMLNSPITYAHQKPAKVLIFSIFMRVDDLDEEIASSKGRLTYLKTDILSMPLPNPKFNLITDYYGPMTY